MHNYDILNNSDERLKKNFAEPQYSALEKLLAIDVMQYDWRISDKHVDMGFIAQQLYDVVPEAVSVSEDTGLYSVKTNRLIPYLVRSVQELYTLINNGISINGQDEAEMISSKARTVRKLRSRSSYTDEQIRTAVEVYKKQAEPKIFEPVRLEPKIVKFEAQ